MLMVDLDRLARERRLVIDEALEVSALDWAPAEDGEWSRLVVHLEVQRAGDDVVVIGEVGGEMRTVCRRCLDPAMATVDVDLALMYQAGIDPFEAERMEVYPLPDRARELDLGEAIREHVLLATPRFVLCREDCKGLCARCGVNLNHAECTCVTVELDARWGPLLRARGRAG